MTVTAVAVASLAGGPRAGLRLLAANVTLAVAIHPPLVSTATTTTARTDRSLTRCLSRTEACNRLRQGPHPWAMPRPLPPLAQGQRHQVRHRPLPPPLPNLKTSSNSGDPLLMVDYPNSCFQVDHELLPWPMTPHRSPPTRATPRQRADARHLSNAGAQPEVRYRLRLSLTDSCGSELACE